VTPLRYEVRLAGAGGQGLVLAGIVLAEAALMEGRIVIHSQNYGPEARGGNSVSEVIISDEEIDYPRALGLDLLVALNQRACSDNMPDMKPDGLVIVDSTYAKKVLWGKVLRVPLQREADHMFQDSRVVNMLALGILTPFCPLVSEDALSKVLSNRMPPASLEHNLKAYRAGVDRGKQLQADTHFHEMEDAIEV
jgi:2-oxoglutarate ferredoxin oxidoreductase subunit gamma